MSQFTRGRANVYMPPQRSQRWPLVCRSLPRNKAIAPLGPRQAALATILCQPCQYAIYVCKNSGLTLGFTAFLHRAPALMNRASSARPSLGSAGRFAFVIARDCFIPLASGFCPHRRFDCADFRSLRPCPASAQWHAANLWPYQHFNRKLADRRPGRRAGPAQ